MLTLDCRCSSLNPPTLPTPTPGYLLDPHVGAGLWLTTQPPQPPKQCWPLAASAAPWNPTRVPLTANRAPWTYKRVLILWLPMQPLQLPQRCPWLPMQPFEPPKECWPLTAFAVCSTSGGVPMTANAASWTLIRVPLVKGQCSHLNSQRGALDCLCSPLNSRRSADPWLLMQPPEFTQKCLPLPVNSGPWIHSGVPTLDC